MIKAWIQTILKSKNILFAIALAAFSTLQATIGLFELTPRITGIIGVLLAVIVAGLRFATTDSLADKATAQQLTNQEAKVDVPS